MQVAIITGAGSGIGLATAKQLFDMGMAIVGVGRDTAKLKTLEKTLGSPDRVATISADITEDEAPQRIVQFALEKFGAIDFLISNAGVGKPKPLHETEDETLDFFLDIMLRAPFRLARDCVPHMKPGSAIINITSTFAVIGGLRGGAYSAAKAGLHGLTLHIACQYGPQGIRCNSVAPGVTMTDMVRERFNDPKFKRMNVDMTPYPRLSEAEDTASTIAFLCSKGAELINGQQIVVDGGWTSTKYMRSDALEAVWLHRDTNAEV